MPARRLPYHRRGVRVWLRSIINMASPKHACRSTPIYAPEYYDDLHEAYVPRVRTTSTVLCEPHTVQTTCLCATHLEVTDGLGYRAALWSRGEIVWAIFSQQRSSIPLLLGTYSRGNLLDQCGLKQHG